MMPILLIDNNLSLKIIIAAKVEPMIIPTLNNGNKTAPSLLKAVKALTIKYIEKKLGTPRYRPPQILRGPYGLPTYQQYYAAYGGGCYKNNPNKCHLRFGG